MRWFMVIAIAAVLIIFSILRITREVPEGFGGLSGNDLTALEELEDLAGAGESAQDSTARSSELGCPETYDDYFGPGEMMLMVGHPFLPGSSSQASNKPMDTTGIDIVWDDTIGLVSFHKEEFPSFGLNVWVGSVQPPKEAGKPCKASVVNADLATAKAACCRPAQIDPHSYVLEPPTGAPGACVENGVEVDEVNAGRISGKLCVNLLEVDIFGYEGETIYLSGYFTAYGR